MIAEISDSQNEEDVYPHPDAMTSISEVSSNSVVQRGTRAIAVRVRVGGELISSKSTSDDNAVKNFDMAMQQVR
jgi:predicted transcriptional regulator